MKMFLQSSLLILCHLMPRIWAVDYPVGITNCGISTWIPKPPSRAVTLNQGTTEVMLALGLEDRMVGTAYLDDEIWPEYAQAYAKIPVLSDGYPQAETLFAKQPDFLYASYSSAFDTTRTNVNYTAVGYNCTLVVPRDDKPDRIYCREELNQDGVHTYLQEPYCELAEFKVEASIDEIRDEIWTIATIFDVLENGRKVIDGIEEHFRMAKRIAETHKDQDEPISVLWLDSWNDETPFVGACCGAIQIILEHAGARNVFEDQGLEEKKSWDRVTWEEIEKRDPDLIVLTDASWDVAGKLENMWLSIISLHYRWIKTLNLLFVLCVVVEKLNQTCHHPISRELRAVQNRAFLTVPFSASTIGVRVGSVAFNMAEAMAALARGRPLPLVEVSDVTLSGDTVELESGLKVFQKLPMVGNVDLDAFCPGETFLEFTERTEERLLEDDDNDGLETWATALIVILGVLVVAFLASLFVMISRERIGNPMFQPMIKDGATST